MRAFLRSIIIVAALLGVAAVTFNWPPLASKSVVKTDPHGHQEHDAHEEGSVEMSDAKVAAAGIELVKAGRGVLHDSIVLNGIVQPNQETLVQVTPRFPGIVREVNKRIGDQVKKGDLLAKIESNQSLTIYQLTAPIGGTIIDRQLALGEYVNEQKPVFTIADLSGVWVDFSVYRRDLGRIRVGDTVLIDAEDGEPPIESKISYISPVGNSDTQSALTRSVVKNDPLRLRPGLFITGRVRLTAKPVNVAIKSSALQTMDNRPVVFVRVGDKFEMRDVELGDRDSEHAEVVFGLLDGDIYAAKNSFVIKAEMAKGSATHEH
jgi:cobalt-zinc-cadmium efflux system membrane fusion protein